MDKYLITMGAVLDVAVDIWIRTREPAILVMRELWEARVLQVPVSWAWMTSFWARWHRTFFPNQVLKIFCKPRTHDHWSEPQMLITWTRLCLTSSRGPGCREKGSEQMLIKLFKSTRERSISCIALSTCIFRSKFQMSTILEFNFLGCLISSTIRPKRIVRSSKLAEAALQKGETMIRIKEVLRRTT